MGHGRTRIGVVGKIIAGSVFPVSSKELRAFLSFTAHGENQFDKNEKLFAKKENIPHFVLNKKRIGADKKNRMSLARTKFLYQR